MVYTKNRLTGSSNLLIYNESILLLSKEDDIVFEINQQNFDYLIKFSFSNEGELYSSTFYKDSDKKTLIYVLHNWDSTTYVEITKPILIEESIRGKFWMKFRNQSLEKKEHRRFCLTIWKEI